jgi:hypothetical protein
MFSDVVINFLSANIQSTLELFCPAGKNLIAKCLDLYI